MKKFVILVLVFMLFGFGETSFNTNYLMAENNSQEEKKTFWLFRIFNVFRRSSDDNDNDYVDTEDTDLYTDKLVSDSIAENENDKVNIYSDEKLYTTRYRIFEDSINTVFKIVSAEQNLHVVINDEEKRTILWDYIELSPRELKIIFNATVFVTFDFSYRSSVNISENMRIIEKPINSNLFENNTIIKIHPDYYETSSPVNPKINREYYLTILTEPKIDMKNTNMNILKEKNNPSNKAITRSSEAANNIFIKRAKENNIINEARENLKMSLSNFLGEFNINVTTRFADEIREPIIPTYQTPNTVSNAVKELFNILSVEEIESVRITPKQQLYKFNHDIGRKIRNHFSLITNERLMRDAGTKNFDKASEIILIAFWKKLNQI